LLFGTDFAPLQLLLVLQLLIAKNINIGLFGNISGVLSRAIFSLLSIPGVIKRQRNEGYGTQE
jgi:hypothetical protein